MGKVKHQWLKEYMLEKPGAVLEYHEAFGVDRYLIGGKMFAMWGSDKNGTPIVSLKLEPGLGDELRQRFNGAIVPGYYMNKTHWNSLYLDADVPKDVIRHMADESYRIIFESLPKKMQKQILERSL